MSNLQAMEQSVSTSSVVEGSSQGNSKKSIASDQWFSVRRIFRDFRRLGSRRQSRKAQSGRNHAEVVTANSCSFYLDEDDNSQFDVTSAALFECPVCTFMQPPSAFSVLENAGCRHRTCSDCMRRYLAVEITESRTEVACPVCAAYIHPDDVRKLLVNDPALLYKYEEFALRRVLVVDPDVRWCPAPDCGYAVIAAGCASCPKLRCERPGCGTLFCYHCKQTWHPNQTCAAARAKRLSSIQSSLSIACSIDSSYGNQTLSEMKGCPRCGALIVKMDDGSCNHMTCTICAAEFCWLCMQEISDIHYLSPSGCTFWGKKQWSRKKKILLQLGMLVGGPIGIALIAVAAIPAIMIGLPVWVGSKLSKRFTKLSRHRRNLVVFGGVLSSIIVSPLLSVLVVVVGVPLLLAYVYGVVPVSLCRSIGNCGIKTTSAGGVKIDFDDEEDCAAPASLSIGPFLSTSNIAGEREMSFVPMSSYVSSGASDGNLVTAETASSRDHLPFAGSRSRNKPSIGPFSNRLEVRAEVSSRSVASPRGSLVDGLASVHGVSKARSTATVSFSDIISTSQDVGIGANFTSPPSETSLNSENCGLRSSGRSASITSSGTSYLSHSIVRPGGYISSSPPLAKRSVSFVRDLGAVSSNERCTTVVGGTRRSGSSGGRNVGTACPWTYKRQCMSVGDSIDERVESATNNDYLSIRSLASPAAVSAGNNVPKLEPCSGGSDIVAMIAASNAVESDGPNGGSALPRATGFHCLAPTSSVDASDCLSDYCSAGSNLGLMSSGSPYGLRRHFSGDQCMHIISANSIDEI